MTPDLISAIDRPTLKTKAADFITFLNLKDKQESLKEMRGGGLQAVVTTLGTAISNLSDEFTDFQNLLEEARGKKELSVCDGCDAIPVPKRIYVDLGFYIAGFIIIFNGIASRIIYVNMTRELQSQQLALDDHRFKIIKTLKIAMFVSGFILLGIQFFIEFYNPDPDKDINEK
jgi:hypothetical protein